MLSSNYLIMLLLQALPLHFAANVYKGYNNNNIPKAYTTATAASAATASEIDSAALPAVTYKSYAPVEAVNPADVATSILPQLPCKEHHHAQPSYYVPSSHVAPPHYYSPFYNSAFAAPATPSSVYWLTSPAALPLHAATNNAVLAAAPAASAYVAAAAAAGYFNPWQAASALPYAAAPNSFRIPSDFAWQSLLRK